MIRIKHAILSFATAALLASPAAFAATYDIDSVHSKVLFNVEHLGFSKMYGLFEDYSGTFDFDATKPNAGALTVKIGTASIKTNNALRDSHLAGPDWFNAKQFPEMTFVGKKFEKLGTKDGVINGELTILGTTRPVTMQVSFNKEGVNPLDKNYYAGFSAHTEIKRSDFGMKTYLGAIGDDVEIIIQVEGRKQ